MYRKVPVLCATTAAPRAAAAVLRTAVAPVLRAAAVVLHTAVAAVLRAAAAAPWPSLLVVVVVSRGRGRWSAWSAGMGVCCCDCWLSLGRRQARHFGVR
jgi:hypothetical protein